MSYDNSYLVTGSFTAICQRDKLLVNINFEEVNNSDILKK